MSDVEEKLAKSLTAESVELIPYLPYLLQDLWELGSSPKDMVHLISKNIIISEKTKVLDLACGKGAVSIKLAKELGCQVKGIDIMKDFIENAKKKAREFKVETLCEFIVGDINQYVEVEKGYDIGKWGSFEESTLNVSGVSSNREDTVEEWSKEEGVSDDYVWLCE